MVGYKSMSELSLKECYDMLCSEQDSARKNALELHYQTLLPLWNERDNLTFSKCRTIEDYNNYLSHFDVYYYQSLHGNDARDAIEDMKHKIKEESDLMQSPESEIVGSSIDAEDNTSSFATTMAWGCLWAIIAPILYIIISIICS